MINYHDTIDMIGAKIMLKNKIYKNGQRAYVLKNKIMKVFFRTGIVKAQGPFANNKMEGEWMFYRKTGELFQIGHFEHNQKHGLWTRFAQDGKVEKKEQYAHGKIDK